MSDIDACQPIEMFFTIVTSWLRRFTSLASLVMFDSTSIECLLALRSFFLRTTSGLYGSETRLSRFTGLWLWLENEPCRWMGVEDSWLKFGMYVWNVDLFCAASIMEPVNLKYSYSYNIYNYKKIKPNQTKLHTIEKALSNTQQNKALQLILIFEKFHFLSLP